MRLPGQVLHAVLQELEFTELHGLHQRTGQPLYCQGVFDAITMGELYRRIAFNHVPHDCGYWSGFKKLKNKMKSCRNEENPVIIFIFSILQYFIKNLLKLNKQQKEQKCCTYILTFVFLLFCLCVSRPECHSAGVSGQCVLDSIGWRRCDWPAASPSALV